jgi:hypothetical protein
MPSQWLPALPVLLFLPTRTLDPLPTHRKQAVSLQQTGSTLGDISHTLLIPVEIHITGLSPASHSLYIPLNPFPKTQ